MQITSLSVDNYLENASTYQQEALTKLRGILRDTLIPLGFEECMSYGMIGYVVPFSLYPTGYHCDTNLPLPFVNIATRNAGIHLYHMGMYVDSDILTWWQDAYKKLDIGKLDMGKSCIRLKNMDTIPYDLIMKLLMKIDAIEWIALYEKNYNKNK